MEMNSTAAASPQALVAGEGWFDPIEAGLRARLRGFIAAMLEAAVALGRGRSQRGLSKGHRHGKRERQRLVFGPVMVSGPRARRTAIGGMTQEWRSTVVPRYGRRPRHVEALIAAADLSDTNTRRVQRALAARFRGAVGKDVVSRAWRKLKVDWQAWSRRDLQGEDIVRLILDGTVVKIRLDRKGDADLSAGGPWRPP